MKISYKQIKTAAVLYAAVSIAIFFLGWLNRISGLVFIALLAEAIYFFIKNSSHKDGKITGMFISKRTLIIIGVISLVWCFMAGQGQFVHQSSDHVIRNAIFRDLISQKWPVVYDDGNSMMSYYIAHWMVPAVFGKMMLFITGSHFAAYMTGNITLLIWSGIGCFIALLLVVMLTNTQSGKRKIIAVLMYIFFSGLDIIGIFINKRMDIIGIHLEWWAGMFQYSSNMTCLYWVYNQTIVPWIMVLCLMNEKKLKNIALLGILVFPYGPFPFVGTVIFCALLTLDSLVKNIRAKTLDVFFKDVLSPQNILALIAVAPVYMLYYSSNGMVAGENTGFRIHDAYTNSFKNKEFGNFKGYIRGYIIFLIIEFALYTALIIKRKKPDIVFIGMSLSLVFIPLFQLGLSGDFAMRASIPALVYTCVTFIELVVKEIPYWGEYGNFNNCIKHRKWLAAAMIVFMIGSVTSITEIKRELCDTVKTPRSEIMDFFSNESLQSYGKANFVAGNYKESSFYKLLGKKSID